MAKFLENEKNFKKYKRAKIDAKKTVSEAKYKSYDNFFCKLDIKIGEEDSYRRARSREKRIRY